MFKINVPEFPATRSRRFITTRKQGEPRARAKALSARTARFCFADCDAVHPPAAVRQLHWPAWSARRTPVVAEAPEEVRKFVKVRRLAARGHQAWRESARAGAPFKGKPNVGFDEVRRVAKSVLGHRLILDYAAASGRLGHAKLVDAC